MRFTRSAPRSLGSSPSLSSRASFCCSKQWKSFGESRRSSPTSWIGCASNGIGDDRIERVVGTLGEASDSRGRA
jgi:hypothetical protein